MNWLTFIKEIFEALSFPTTAFFAYKGVVVWREQLRGKDKYNISKSLLKSVYRIKETIKYLRSPMFTSGEINVAMKKHFPEVKIDPFDKTEEDQKKIDSAVFRERWLMIKDVYAEYELAKYEAIVHWGTNMEVILSEFEKTLNSLKIRTNMYPSLQPGLDKSREKFEEYIFGYSPDGKDEFQDKFLSCISKIENILLPEIK